MTPTAIWVLWLIITGIGMYYCARVANQAYKDLSWVKRSRLDGQLMVDAKHQTKQTTLLFSKQVAGFLLGALLPLIESRQVRGWLFLTLVAFWSLSSTLVAYWSLQNRHRQWEDEAERRRGQMRTREGEADHQAPSAEEG
jgi:hypothetical protein